MKNTVQNNNTHSPKSCFSYIRYSSKNQHGNSSVDRQSDVAPKIAMEKGWVLRNEWNVTQKAVSAFKKHNFPKLMAIAEQVRGGIIPPGTVMIIEAIDRLTRATLDEGREMIRQLLLAGLEICDKDGIHYTKDSLNDSISLILLIVKIQAANDYVAKLSERVIKAYDLRIVKMQAGEVLFKNQHHGNRQDMPPWFDNKGDSYEPNGKAETIASLFSLYLGGMGSATITRKFNQEKVISFSGKIGTWSQSHVYRLLSDRRVIGDIKVKGNWIKGYYPAIVTEEVFSRVQAKFASNKGKPVTGKFNGAQQASISNIFTGVGVCVCGTSFKVSSGSGGRYVICYAGLKGLCKQAPLKYEKLETAFKRILQLNPAQLLPNEESPNAEVQLLTGRVERIKTELANLTGIARKGLATHDMLKTGLDMETQVKEIQAQIELARAKDISAQGGAERLAEICLSLDDLATDQTLRAQVQSWIRENCNRVTVNRTAKSFSVDLKNGTLIEMSLAGSILGTNSVEALFGLSAPAQAAKAAAK